MAGLFSECGGSRIALRFALRDILHQYPTPVAVETDSEFKPTSPVSISFCNPILVSFLATSLQTSEPWPWWLKGQGHCQTISGRDRIIHLISNEGFHVTRAWLHFEINLYVETIKSSKEENVHEFGAYLNYWKQHSYIFNW